MMKFTGLAFLLLVFCTFFLFSISSSQAQVACPGVNHCRAGYTQIPPPILGIGKAVVPVDLTGIVLASYCGQGGQECANCNNFQTNLQNEMGLHRVTGSRVNSCSGRFAGTKNSFLFDTYWNRTVHPGLQNYLNKIIAAMTHSTAMRGSLSDAQNTVRSQGALQESAAETAQSFVPSEALCRFGSLSQSLASDDATARTAQLALATIGLKRNLGSRDSIAQEGLSADMRARLTEFVAEYCNYNQNGENGLGLMCGTPATNPQRRFASLPRDTRFNRDINYTRTIDADGTLDIDMTDQANLRAGEQDVVSLGHNLYGAQQMSGRISAQDMRYRDGQATYLKIRSVAASRAVAQNSYAAIAGMKSRGSGAAQPYMKAMFAELGIDNASASSILGDKPSYYAQMDVLTKKLYQNPTFYVNLMEGKTNVARQSGAMEGIELMQDRDIYRSMSRSEMLLALLVQLQSNKILGDTAEDVNTR